MAAGPFCILPSHKSYLCEEGRVDSKETVCGIHIVEGACATKGATKPEFFHLLPFSFLPCSSELSQR